MIISQKKMKHDILFLLNKYFNEHNFNINLSNNFSISSLFRYKDKLNKGMMAGTVYEWSCLNCRVHYIGSSPTNLYVLAAEHAGVSFRTGQHLSHPLILASEFMPSIAIVSNIFTRQLQHHRFV